MATVPRPFVSVLTPTFQGEAFVASTIESVLAQTYEPVEHILVDDGSTDGTPELLEDYQRRYPDRVRVLRFDSRNGPCRRRNQALAEARGTLIAWLDHDDVWVPEKLERQVELLLREPTAAVCFTQYEEFDDETGETTYQSQIDGKGDFLDRLFVTGCFVASSTALFRREAIARRARGFREVDFSFGDDYFLWLTLLIDSRAVLVDEVLARLRRHPGNESARLGLDNSELRALRLLEEYLERLPIARVLLGGARRRGLARHWAAAAEWEFTLGSRRRAAAFAIRAAVFDPRGAGIYARRRAAAALRQVALGGPPAASHGVRSRVG